MPYWELIGTQNPSPLSCSLGVISEPKSIIFAWNSHLQCNELQRKLLCRGILGQGGRALTSFCLFVLNRVLEECEPGDLLCGWLPVRSTNGTTCQNPFSVPGPPIKCVTSWTHLPLSHLALLSWVEVDLGQLAEKAAVSSTGGTTQELWVGRTATQHTGHAGLFREEKQSTKICKLPSRNAILTNISARVSKSKKKIDQYEIPIVLPKPSHCWLPCIALLSHIM